MNGSLNCDHRKHNQAKEARLWPLGRRVPDARVVWPACLLTDEYFVSERTALAGVMMTNLSETELLVMLKHFDPENRETPAAQPVGK